MNRVEWIRFCKRNQQFLCSAATETCYTQKSEHGGASCFKPTILIISHSFRPAFLPLYFLIKYTYHLSHLESNCHNFIWCVDITLLNFKQIIFKSLLSVLITAVGYTEGNSLRGLQKSGSCFVRSLYCSLALLRLTGQQDTEREQVFTSILEKFRVRSSHMYSFELFKYVSVGQSATGHI